jgi:acetolactate synthase I/II/III large subunit
MKLSDYIIQYLADKKVTHVFLITGGAIAHVVDSFRNAKGIQYVCHNHEQAASMAAEAYARLSGTIGVAMATSGPGATNLITGMCCAWFDSIPVLYITGQVNRHEQKGKTRVRQVGFQETDIIEMVRPVTKYAAMVTRAEDIRYQLDKAITEAYAGRPGPVLLDIPMDIQRADINPKRLRGYSPKTAPIGVLAGKAFISRVARVVALFKKARRPVIIAGGGIRLSGAYKEFQAFLDACNAPVVTSWSGFDAVPWNHPRHIGQFGVYGSRAANFAVQTADLVLSIGSRLDTRQTGGRPDTFAPHAKKIMVDVDSAELKKRRGYTPDIEICADAKVFLREAERMIRKEKNAPSETAWVARTQEWKQKYPAVLPEYYSAKKDVNSYVFVKTLSDLMPSPAVIIPDNGGNLTWTMQAFQLKEGQRLFSAFGNSPMGYSFPASLGAAYAVRNAMPVVGIIGDGSFQMNIQELQTVFHNKIPIKLFILNNRSYGIIKQFQDTLFESRYEATQPTKGYSPPDFGKVIGAYGLTVITIRNHRELAPKIKDVLKEKGPVFCDVSIYTEQKLVPKLEFGNPIEDLGPELSREEFAKNMNVVNEI